MLHNLNLLNALTTTQDDEDNRSFYQIVQDRKSGLVQIGNQKFTTECVEALVDELRNSPLANFDYSLKCANPSLGWTVLKPYLNGEEKISFIAANLRNLADKKNFTDAFPSDILRELANSQIHGANNLQKLNEALSFYLNEKTEFKNVPQATVDFQTINALKASFVLSFGREETEKSLPIFELLEQDNTREKEYHDFCMQVESLKGLGALFPKSDEARIETAGKVALFKNALSVLRGEKRTAALNAASETEKVKNGMLDQAARIIMGGEMVEKTHLRKPVFEIIDQQKDYVAKNHVNGYYRNNGKLVKRGDSLGSKITNFATNKKDEQTIKNIARIYEHPDYQNIYSLVEKRLSTLAESMRKEVCRRFDEQNQKFGTDFKLSPVYQKQEKSPFEKKPLFKETINKYISAKRSGKI